MAIIIIIRCGRIALTLYNEYEHPSVRNSNSNNSNSNNDYDSNNRTTLTIIIVIIAIILFHRIMY